MKCSMNEVVCCGICAVSQIGSLILVWPGHCSVSGADWLPALSPGELLNEPTLLERELLRQRDMYLYVEVAVLVRMRGPRHTFPPQAEDSPVRGASGDLEHDPPGERRNRNLATQ